MTRPRAPRLAVLIVAILIIAVRLGVPRLFAPAPSRERNTGNEPTTRNSGATTPAGQVPGGPPAGLGDSAPVAASDSGCPVEGDARNPRVQALNVLKNRTAVPTPAELDTTITAAMLVAPGNDRDRFTPRKAVRVSGYVADVKVGGVETVNCKAKDPDARDTHIELTLEPMSEDEAKHLIVEVTPRWRAIVAARGEDWSTRALRRDLKGRWVEVTGWLLYDEEHEANAANTHRGKANIWRATVWEVHPITGLRVLERPPGR